VVERSVGRHVDVGCHYGPGCCGISRVSVQWATLHSEGWGVSSRYSGKKRDEFVYRQSGKYPILLRYGR